jgi:hypothetical protein
MSNIIPFSDEEIPDWLQGDSDETITADLASILPRAIEEAQKWNETVRILEEAVAGFDRELRQRAIARYWSSFTDPHDLLPF